MRLCKATQGGLVIEETPKGIARQRIRPLALKALTIQEADALLPTPEDTTAHTQSEAPGEQRWLRYELPLQPATNAASVSTAAGQESRALVLLGWSAQTSMPTVKRAAARLEAVTEAAGAVVAALRLARQQDGADSYENDAPVSNASAAPETDSAWEQIFDAVSDPICVVSADYRLERANAAYIKLFGLNRHGIPGHECFASQPGQTGPCANCPLPHTIQTRSADFVQQERLVPTSDGAFERRIFQRWVYPIFQPDGAVTRIVEILKDVTDQEQTRRAMNQAEALREADQLKSELLGTVSHELRSPLTTIKGYAATLLRHERRLPREERQEFLTAIVEASDALQVIIDRLLEMSQIETGALRMERMEVNLHELAIGAIKDIERSEVNRAQPYDFAVTLESVDPNRPDTQWEVEGDPRLLRDMLDNLLENAVKYSPNGGHIEVQLSAHDEAHTEDANSASGRRPNRAIELVVQDTGMGIPQEQLSRIFDRFHRVDTRLTREIGGLGLGLAICQSIVERHNGTIWAESTPGQGSSFHVRLPAASSDI